MLRASLSICASCTIGDVVCQHLSDAAYDARRTAAFATSGLCVLGPVSYTILSTATALLPGSSTLEITRRILLIQLVEPIRIGAFLPATALLAGSSVEAAVDKARRDTLPTVWRSWCVFTPVLFVAFRHLRAENRVPLLASVGAIWNSYMSYVAYGQRKQAAG